MCVVGSGEPQRGTAVALHVIVQLHGHSRQPQCSQLPYIIDYFSQSCATSAILSLSIIYILDKLEMLHNILSVCFMHA